MPRSPTPRAVCVVGGPGAGKTHFARRLADVLGAEHIEIDAVFHQPGWAPLPTDVLRERLAQRLVPGGAWVVDGNYRVVQDIIWSRADTVVWLDLPRWRAMLSLVRRSFLRVALRQRLWNGNREHWRDVCALWSPERSILAWAWTRHRAYRQRYEAAMADPAHARLRFVRLRSRRLATAWLDEMMGRSPGHG